MGRPLVCLDLDETLIRSVDAFVKLNNAYFGTIITNEEYREEWHKTRWNTGYSEEEWEKKQGSAWVRHALDTGFYRDLPAMPGAREALEYYARLGVRFAILTSRRAEVREDSLYCLGKLFPNTRFEDYLSTGFYGGDAVSNDALKRTKGEMVARIGADVLVDDQLRHVASSVEHGIPAIWFGEQPADALCGPLAAAMVGAARDGMYFRARTWTEVFPVLNVLLRLD